MSSKKINVHVPDVNPVVPITGKQYIINGFGESCEEQREVQVIYTSNLKLALKRLYFKRIMKYIDIEDSDDMIITDTINEFFNILNVPKCTWTSRIQR